MRKLSGYVIFSGPEGCMMRYYDLNRNWTRKIMPHLGDQRLNKILVRDFNRYSMAFKAKQFTPGMLPCEIEECDPWWLGHRGPKPRFWRYVKYEACHWIVNFALRLAARAEPTKTWQIVTSPMHSTVWDGQETLFDFNYQAFGIAPQECWVNAYHDGLVLIPGAERPRHLDEMWPLFSPEVLGVVRKTDERMEGTRAA